MKSKLLISKVNLLELLKYFFIIFLTVMFVVELIQSFKTQMHGDSEYLHYMAYLINEHGFIPYKDLFEINMPGTYLFHIIIGKLFGYSEFALRMLNTIWLLILFVVTWFIMKPFGIIPALASSLLFGLIFLGFGPSMALERDAIAILPIALAVLIAIKSQQKYLNLTYFVIGVLFAFTALIKPFLAIGFPIIIAFMCTNSDSYLRTLKNHIKPCIYRGFFILIGFMITLSIPFLWLWYIGALNSFLEMYISYVPLYLQIPGNREFNGTFLNSMYTLYTFTTFQGFGVLFAISMFGVYLVHTLSNSKDLKKLSILLLSLSIFYSLYVLVSGKLWNYYWLPYIYFVSLGTSIVLFLPSKNIGYLKIFPFFAFIVATMPIFHQQYSLFTKIVTQSHTITHADIQEKEITNYLNKNLTSNDKVQTLGWDLPPLEAMLNAKAIPATKYIIKLQFFHHISNPYIQYLRKDFIEKMIQEMPKFIIDIHSFKSLELDGPNQFPELKQFIKRHYVKDYIGNNFEIYKKIDNTYNNYDFNQTINFKNNGNMSQFLDEGWSHPESSHIWSIDKKSSLNFHTQLPKCNLTVALTVSPFYLEGKMKPQELKIVVNGKQLLSTILTTQKTLNFHIPIDIWNLKSPTTIEFLHPNSISPQELGVSQDSRELGFAFQKMIIKECQ